jgi:hypothetical protein
MSSSSSLSLSLSLDGPKPGCVEGCVEGTCRSVPGPSSSSEPQRSSSSSIVLRTCPAPYAEATSPLQPL